MMTCNESQRKGLSLYTVERQVSENDDTTTSTKNMKVQKQSVNNKQENIIKYQSSQKKHSSRNNKKQPFPPLFHHDRTTIIIFNFVTSCYVASTIYHEYCCKIAFTKAMRRSNHVVCSHIQNDDGGNSRT